MSEGRRGGGRDGDNRVRRRRRKGGKVIWQAGVYRSSKGVLAWLEPTHPQT